MDLVTLSKSHCQRCLILRILSPCMSPSHLQTRKQVSLSNHHIGRRIDWWGNLSGQFCFLLQGATLLSWSSPLCGKCAFYASRVVAISPFLVTSSMCSCHFHDWVSPPLLTYLIGENTGWTCPSNRIGCSIWSETLDLIWIFHHIAWMPSVFCYISEWADSGTRKIKVNPTHPRYKTRRDTLYLSFESDLHRLM